MDSPFSVNSENILSNCEQDSSFSVKLYQDFSKCPLWAKKTTFLLGKRFFELVFEEFIKSRQFFSQTQCQICSLDNQYQDRESNPLPT